MNTDDRHGSFSEIAALLEHSRQLQERNEALEQQAAELSRAIVALDVRAKTVFIRLTYVQLAHIWGADIR